jgi:very-short-patch-repair endonuclease
MTEQSPQERLIGILDYILELEKLKKAATYVVPSQPFVAYQESFKDLPGVTFNLVRDDDDVWLRIARLQEGPPPAPAKDLEPWIVLSKSTEKLPTLREEIKVEEPNPDPKIKTPVIRTIPAKSVPDLKSRFDAYVERQWAPWAETERPRRRTIGLYNKLFTLCQVMSSEGVEQPIELVWGLGLALWKPEAGREVRHPLITQACEVTLDPKSLELDVRPRELPAVLEADCYAEMDNPGVRALQAVFKQFVTSAASSPCPFEPESFESILKAAVGHLDARGRYLKLEDGRLPPANEALAVTDGWVLYARPRSGHVIVEDIERLKRGVESGSELPPATTQIVTIGDTEVKPRPTVNFRGLSSSSMGGEVKELYFPLPHNDEQKRIIELLEVGDGVVVQGPPGTGKTHTIANVIAHFLAQGKRVLVTAKSEQALAVLQEKVPENIRALTVALLSSEKDGMQQFEASIRKIATEVASINPLSKQGEVNRLEQRLEQLHAKLSALDHDIQRLAAKHLKVVMFCGREMMAEELARLVLDGIEEHGWLTDPVAFDAEPKFGTEDISALRKARETVGADLPYLEYTLPGLDALPTEAELLSLHRDLIRAHAIEHRVDAGEVLPLIDSTPETYDTARALEEQLKRHLKLRKELAAEPYEWTFKVRDVLRSPRAQDFAAFLAASVRIREEDADRRSRLARPVVAPAGAESNQEVRESLERLVAGKSAFALPFGKKAARAILAEITVAGLAPTTEEDWTLVQAELDHRLRTTQLLASWKALASETPIAADVVSADFRAAAQVAQHLERVENFTLEIEPHTRAQSERVFGRAVLEKLELSSQEEDSLAKRAESLEQQLDRGRLAYANARVRDILDQLADANGPVVESLGRVLREDLGNSALEEMTLGDRWRELRAELKRLHGLREPLIVIDRVTSLIEESGAPLWARRLRSEPVLPEAGETLLPGTWLEAWRWRGGRTLLESLDGHDKLRRLFETRKESEQDLAHTYRELVAAKTWLGVYHNSPDSVRQALQAYLTSMQSIGKGTGIRAIRHRRDARAAMARAYRAVPCWIMPEWRVSETLPAEIGTFDLVIIDEASQADIWALPALLRGKKMLVVGDHCQVSPSAVGIPEAKILELKERFLATQPHGQLMTPDRSIYDLALTVFAGSQVMLKEHFRSVPAIIAFSNRWYDNQIKPLRVPKRSERLDPPLIDVYVRGGYYENEINDPEARAIVDEIASILADRRMAGRSIGVVTLLGQKQAAHIDKLVHRAIDAKAIVERRIRVGNPTVFQGDERDIMLLSMVIDGKHRGVPSRREFEQRFNVAASRARDRMYLFRSAEEADVTPGNLNAQLMAHFRQPFKQDRRTIEALRQLCESNFERDMFDLLVARNYRVRPQMPVAGYRIDLVIEGAEDRRLAIECDGDRFHGPGQWLEDMTRQRILERAGWTFWRCFGSSFVLHRKEVEHDLFATLERMGIEPLGSESVDSTQWVDHRVVDPLDLGGGDRSAGQMTEDEEEASLGAAL